MAAFISSRWLTVSLTLFAALSVRTISIEIYHDWDVAFDHEIQPLGSSQPVITINKLFPGPLINGTTNDNIHVNVHNNLDEPLLMTWNGIQQRLNSWQDGVLGTNCPISPGQNWTYVFQMKDQIGTFSYFPSTNAQKLAGGFGPIRVNNRDVISVPFPKPENEFDIVINDWYKSDYKVVRSSQDAVMPDAILFNGEGSGESSISTTNQAFYVTQGKTYRFRISNLGSVHSINFRIQNHKMVIVETEGSYTNQITLESLDVHVGQSYSVLVTANQADANYYIVASPKLVTLDYNSPLVAKALLRYSNSQTDVNGALPSGPDPFDMDFSADQAKSIRWNLTTGAARPNPQGSFNVNNITLSQTFILHGSKAEIDGQARYAINSVSYFNPSTPLKLADYYLNGSGVYQLDAFPMHSVNNDAAYGTNVVTGQHKGWLEIVLHNEFSLIDSWHLDGYSLFVVGWGSGEWTPEARNDYNIDDPVVRSTVQVYPHGWTAVYVFLDNPGMWNLRSQLVRNWYLGQELYIRVFNEDTDPAKERPPPGNLLLCGILAEAPTPGGSPSPALPSTPSTPSYAPSSPPIPAEIAPAPEYSWW